MQTNHPQGLSHGEIRMLQSEGTGEGWGSPCKPKSLNFTLLLDKNITYWEIPDIGKKVSLIAFRYVLTKISPAACIQIHNQDLFEKVQLKTSYLIQNCVQQDYPPESYAGHPPSFQKCHNIVAPSRCGLFPLPQNPYGKPWG